MHLQVLTKQTLCHPICTVWLRTNKLSKLVLVIKQKDTGETLERWMFDIQVDKTAQEPSQQVQITDILCAKGIEKGSFSCRMNERQAEEQDESNILSQDTKRQIRAIMRQISASVTFLPDLEDQDCKLKNNKQIHIMHRILTYFFRYFQRPRAYRQGRRVSKYLGRQRSAPHQRWRRAYETQVFCNVRSQSYYHHRIQKRRGRLLMVRIFPTTILPHLLPSIPYAALHQQ